MSAFTFSALVVIVLISIIILIDNASLRCADVPDGE